MRTIKSNWFYGNEVSDYGKENGFVDYDTLAKSFEAVLNNTVMSATSDIGYWEAVNSSEEYHEDEDGTRYTPDEAEELIEQLRLTLDSMDDGEARDELESRIDELEEPHYYDVFQWYIINDGGAEILKEWTDEIVYYNEALDMYLWGVTHCGTSWSYVLTDIKIESEDENTDN